MPTDNGKFITLEGCEGSGKSTQLQLLKEYFNEHGVDAVFTREPGGTEISENIRNIILSGKNTEMSDETEALLFAAARAQHVKQKILPAKADGKIVVCDRYLHSSLAYQAYARGLGYKFVSEINAYAIENCLPDVALFLDISPERAFERKGGADTDDRMEQSGIAFHRRVYDGYLALEDKFRNCFVKINADADVESVFNQIITTLKARGIIKL